MKIAVEGCCHGELDKIYDTVIELERRNGFKIDLLIICGDFQAVRNFDDLQAMAVPKKYQQLNTFYKYYNREKTAPVLTIFIGGNHEASNYMQELPYGGWVAPNIYYMGYAGIIQIGNVRIGGISGIFKGHDYNRGHFEKPPYDASSVRSVYHVRNLEVFRLKQITRPVDIFISHDWPQGIYHYGDTEGLIRRKPFFRQEIEDNRLGSRPLFDVLCHLQPTYWFAAHLHVKFAAHYQHQPMPGHGAVKSTKFLSLDKCLPKRAFLQVLDIPHAGPLKINLDPEWLCVLQKTNHLLNLTSSNKYMPGPGCGERFEFCVKDHEIKELTGTFGGDLTLPENFVQTSPPIEGNPNMFRQQRHQLQVQVNPQTTLLCSMLAITDPNASFLGTTSEQLLGTSFPQAADKDDSGDDVVIDSDEDMPSTVDSMEVSTNISAWDKASESLNASSLHTPKHKLMTSTPARNGPHSQPFLSLVEDNDAELLAILSAQKTKSLVVSSSPPQKDLNSSVCDRVPTGNHQSMTPQGDAARAVNECCELPEPRHFSPTLNKSESSPSHPCPTLKSERTSFGMSGLCLDAAELSSSTAGSDVSLSLSRNNNSLESAKGTGSQVTATPVRGLKRRNVSVYSEPLE